MTNRHVRARELRIDHVDAYSVMWGRWFQRAWRNDEKYPQPSRDDRRTS